MLLEILVMAVLVGGVLLARRNLRLGRGDRRGAMRLAAAFFAISMLSWIFGASHVVGPYELQSLTTCLARNLFEAGFVWLVYIALEPYVRRRWPSTIISWSRLLAGGLRDPLVGRDLLVGFVAATGLVVLGTIRFFVPGWLGLAPSIPRGISPPTLLGGRHAISILFGLSHVLIFTSLGMLFLLILLRILLRRQWAAVVACVLLSLVVGVQAGTALRLDAPLLGAIYVGVSAAVNLVVLMRFGLVALIASSLFSFLFSLFPITPQPSAWYAPSGYVALAVVLAMLLYGFRIALAGRPLFGAALLED